MAILPRAEALPFANPAAPCGPAHSTATSAASRLVSAIFANEFACACFGAVAGVGQQAFFPAPCLSSDRPGKLALQRLVRRYGPAD
jgi:hypothetical protein